MKALRERLGVTQEALAQRMGFSRNYVSMVEKGRNPGPRFIKQLALLEISSGLRPVPNSEQAGEQRSPRLTDPEAMPRYGGRARIKAAREAAGLSVKELAKRLGAQISYVQGIEDGRTPADERFLRKLVKALPELELDDLMHQSESASVIDPSGTTGTVGATVPIFFPPGTRARFVPRLSFAQAGAMQEWTDELYAHEGVVAMDLPANSRAFAVLIRGKSMEPRYEEGDEVIVLYGATPRNGETVVACLINGDVLCKIYQEQQRGELVTLSSYNPAHAPIQLSREEVRWVYPVHSSIRRERRN